MSGALFRTRIHFGSDSADGSASRRGNYDCHRSRRAIPDTIQNDAFCCTFFSDACSAISGMGVYCAWAVQARKTFCISDVGLQHIAFLFGYWFCLLCCFSIDVWVFFRRNTRGCDNDDRHQCLFEFYSHLIFSFWYCL